MTSMSFLGRRGIAFGMMSGELLARISHTCLLRLAGALHPRRQTCFSPRAVCSHTALREKRRLPCGYRARAAPRDEKCEKCGLASRETLAALYTARRQVLWFLALGGDGGLDFHYSSTTDSPFMPT